MNTELRLDRRLNSFPMPPIKSIEKIEMGDGDLFITAAGFEDRCMAALEMATIYDIKGDKKFLIFEYLPFIKENNILKIKKLLDRPNYKLSVYQYNREAPYGVFNDLIKQINRIEGNIFIDISGMSKLLIVQLLNLMGKSDRRYSKTTIIYTMANEYPPSIKEVEEVIDELEDKPIALLSSGVYDLCIVPELSSIYMAGQPIRLIVFPSFNTQQISALRNEIQASYFSIINGIPFLEKNKWRTKIIRTLNNIDQIQQKEEHYISTFDYAETLRTLLKIYDQYSVSDKLLIAPTGSKMQTVAVGILRNYLKDIQIVYPMPRTFPKPHNYTKGVLQTYELDLNRFSDFNLP